MLADPSTFGRGKGPPPGEKQFPLNDHKSTKTVSQTYLRSTPDKKAKLFTTLAQESKQTAIPVYAFRGTCGSPKILRILPPNIPVEVTEMKMCDRKYFYFFEDGWISGENLKSTP